MSLYLAEIDEFYTYQPYGRNDGQWERRTRTLLLDAADIHDAWGQAERIGEVNAMFGPRPLGIEVRKVHPVALPVAISFHAEGGEAK